MLYSKHHLPSNTKIVVLLEANTNYLVGSFATFVKGCQQKNLHFKIYVKDGERIMHE